MGQFSVATSPQTGSVLSGIQQLRITAGLIANVDTAMDAEGIRQWALPEASGTVPGKGGGPDGGG
jgi:hypothetical protein